MYTALLFGPQTSDRVLYLLALAPFQYPIKDSKYMWYKDCETPKLKYKQFLDTKFNSSIFA